MQEENKDTTSASSSCCCCCKRHGYIKKIFFLVALTILAVGISYGGWFIADGLYHIRMSDKVLSVKGLAERRVKADLAIWEIDFKAAGDDLAATNNKIANDQKLIINFLTSHGIAKNEISMQQTSVLDQYAKEYDTGQKPQNRYIMSSEIRVRTDKVDLVNQLSSITSALIAQGVILSKEYGTNPRYLFTKLNDIRPEVLTEAAKSANIMADRFVKDAGVTLGTMKRANQGVFQILAADTASDSDQENSIDKVVRVVTSIDYFLK